MMTGETATITATVLDSNGNPCEGETVYFEVVDGESLGSDVTDSSGEASVYYLGKGTGDIYIKAECTFVSEIYELEDCIFYDPATSNAKASAWTIPTGVTSQYSSNGWRISANAYKQIKLTEKITNPCSVEFTLSDRSANSSGAGVIIAAYTNGETTPNQRILMGGASKTSDRKVFDTQLDHDLIIGAKYRIEYTSSTIKVYENNTLLGQATNSVGLPTRFEWHMGTNRYAIYKDLKVKPL